MFKPLFFEGLYFQEKFIWKTQENSNLTSQFLSDSLFAGWFSLVRLSECIVLNSYAQKSFFQSRHK